MAEEEGTTTTRKAPARKAPARKSPAKKTAAREGTGRVRRERKPAGPLHPQVREAAAKAIAQFTETILEKDDLGVLSTTTKELTGNRSGMVTRVKLDNGAALTLTIAQRG